MNRFSGASAAALAIFLLMPMAQAADQTWITLERGTAQQALIGLAAAGRPGALVIEDAGRPEALSTSARESEVTAGAVRTPPITTSVSASSSATTTRFRNATSNRVSLPGTSSMSAL